jgi:hypothetical protein
MNFEKRLKLAKKGLLQYDKIYKDWKKLVNLTPKELKYFMKTEEGKKAGLKKSEAKKLKIKSGQESAKWILKMKKTKKWTPQMWAWALTQIAFIKRMKKIKGPLFKNNRPTRKLTSLLIWGHHPMRK